MSVRPSVSAVVRHALTVITVSIVTAAPAPGQPGPVPYPELAHPAAQARPGALHPSSMFRPSLVPTREAAPNPLALRRSPTCRLSALDSVDGTWSTLVGSPGGRSLSTAIFDPVDARVLVFSGYVGGGFTPDDLWELSMSPVAVWRQISPAGTLPVGRQGAASVYDPLRRRMLVIGGQSDGPPLSDVWAMSLSGTPTWTQILPTGSPPAPRIGHTAVYDSLRDRVVLFGGFDGFGGESLYNDVWELKLGGATPHWRQLQPTGPLPHVRGFHSAMLDPVGDRLVVFGGISAFDSSGTPAGLLNDTWALSLADSTWSTLATSGTPPTPRGAQATVAFRDGSAYGMLVLGGWDGTTCGDVWELSLGGTHPWTLLSPSPYHGSVPAPRFGQVAVTTGSGPDVIVFGGQQGMGDSTLNLDDVWNLSRSGSVWSWSRPDLQLAATPPPSYDHSAVYDPDRARMLTFGGVASYPDGAMLSSELWAVSLGDTTTCTPLIALPGSWPGARAGQSAVYDTQRQRMILFGGWNGAYLNDLFALSATDTGTVRWTQLFPMGLPCGPRWGHSAIYDPVRDRMVVFGGCDGVAICGDVWALSLSGRTQWQMLGVGGGPGPSARYDHCAIYDPVRDRMIVFGGSTEYGDQNDVWSLSLADVEPQWTSISTGYGPPSMHGQAAIYDPVRDRMIVFGPPWGELDAWALSLGEDPQWTNLDVAGSRPVGREGHTTTYFPGQDCAVLFGGTCNDVEFLGGLQKLAFTSSQAGVGLGGVERLSVGPIIPNPARGSVRFALGLPDAAEVRAEVFDLSGRRVRVLLQNRLPAGTRSLSWDGTDTFGVHVAPGIYFNRVQAGGQAVTRRFVMLR
jgi:hypothetical protein